MDVPVVDWGRLTTRQGTRTTHTSVSHQSASTASVPPGTCLSPCSYPKSTASSCYRTVLCTVNFVLVL
ncbi:uncharacterized protein YALI1_E36323g [Yarrowia lipolytica]|uniref:Uncharacterized protein n=1 Tax=Yarrowia lipolytica TaxID=4952 RepID=A0A1D8NKQ1_YARLL|nr:hypothetical protein YALI1_E36323g [Yarrowia lipolytica]